jgi:hypothetical protein
MIPLALITVALLTALALWWFHRGERQYSRGARVPNLKYPHDDFHCVELRFRTNACDAVKVIGTKRFLPGEVPAIPLPGCDAARCSCRYVRHDDRRHSDRRNPLQDANQWAGSDRRTERDRRRPAKTPFEPKMGR